MTSFLQLDETLAIKLMSCLLTGLRKETPNIILEKPDRFAFLFTTQDENQSPRTKHPVFFGSFDYHSSVHSYLTLIKLVFMFPTNSKAQECREFVNTQFTTSNLMKEIAILNLYPLNFEMPYGFSWLLLLIAELQRQSSNFSIPPGPLALFETVIKGKIISWLTSINEPNHSGLHSNTAFSLTLLIDYAKMKEDVVLFELISTTAETIYGEFLMSKAAFPPEEKEDEPGRCSSFLSPQLCLLNLFNSLGSPHFTIQSLLITRKDITEQLETLTPKLGGDPDNASSCHLIGLNFSRCWGLVQLASFFGSAERKEFFLNLAKSHLDTSLPLVDSGYWMGDHWTVTFLVKALLSFV